MDKKLYGVARLYARSGVSIGIRIFSSFNANKLFNYGCKDGVFITYELAEEELKDILKCCPHLIWVRLIRDLDWEELNYKEEVDLLDWINFQDDEDEI